MGENRLLMLCGQQTDHSGGRGGGGGVEAGDQCFEGIRIHARDMGDMDDSGSSGV